MGRPGLLPAGLPEGRPLDRLLPPPSPPPPPPHVGGQGALLAPRCQHQPSRVFLLLQLGLNSSGRCLALFRERRCAWSVLASCFSGDGGAVPWLSTGCHLVGVTGRWVLDLSRQLGLRVSVGSGASGRGCVTVAKEPPSASVPGRAMGSACPVRPCSQLVTVSPATAPCPPASPQGWQGHTVLLYSFPCPSTPHTQHPTHPATRAPCTPSTLHAVHPAPHALSTRHTQQLLY